MSNVQREGGCQCGGVRYVATGEPVVVAVCHCVSCRRAHAAPAVAWAMFAESEVDFGSSEPATYASSDEARRGFCGRCGTQILFTASFLPGLVDIAVGSLDDPESVTPAYHFWHSKHLSWAEFADDLPRHPEFPPMS